MAQVTRLGLYGGPRKVYVGFSARDDTTAPVLSLATGTATGDTTATGTVDTDEAGTLYFYASTNSSESAATIKASGDNQAATTGTQNVSFSGLTATTEYYAHYVEDDSSSNESNVVSSLVFITTVTATGGRKRRLKRYVVEVDGELFDVENISQAQSILQRVRDLAEESAERDVRTEITLKPPRIKVVTVTGKATTSKILQREVKRTQQVVRKAYNEAARRLSVNREISNLILKSIEREDDLAAIMLLL